MKKLLLLLGLCLTSVFNYSQIANQPTSFDLCDDETQDGVTAFDLTLKDAEILGNQNPNDFIVSYHLTPGEANANLNALASPFVNFINPQTLYVRVEEIISGNFDSTTLIIRVLPNPVAGVPNVLEVCDDDNDGFSTFDLTINGAIILNGESGNTISYFLSESDAIANTNLIANPTAFANTTPNFQTIYVRLENATTGCFSIVDFNIIVNVLNINAQAFDVISCESSNGFGVFDLTINETQILNGISNLEVSYFESLNDAYSGLNQITQPNTYFNTQAYNQTIYMRILDLSTGCVFVSDLLVLYLETEELIINNPTALYSPDPDGDGITNFNLDSKISEIANGNTNLSITFHETQVDSYNNVNAISSPYTNVVAFSQTVYVRVENFNTLCNAFTSLDLVTQSNSFQVNPATLNTCQDFSGNISFNLTTANPEILNGLDPANYTIVYYEVYDDAVLENNAISNPLNYIYSPNIPVIYAGVTEVSTTEYVITTINLNLYNIPIADFDYPGSICDNSSVVLNPNSNPNATFSWNTGENTPTITINIGGYYEVTVTDNVTGCTNTAGIDVMEYQTPVLSTPNDITACIQDVVNIASQLDELIQNPSTSNGAFYNFEHYLTLSDAQNQTNLITNPSQYVAIQNETIYLRVSPIGTECNAITSFNLIVSDCGTQPEQVTCGQPVSNSFCYDSEDGVQYTYTSTNGSPLELIISSGQVENIYDELIVLDTNGTNLNATIPYGNNGDVSNLSFQSTGDTITIYVDSDNSISCQSSNYNPITYTVDCFDTTAVPNCDSVLISPQDLEVDVNENINFTWSNATGLVTGYKISLGTSSGATDVLNLLDVGNITTYNVGTLNFATNYYVTITPYNANGDATGCSETTFTTRADPNVYIDCTLNIPVNTTFCYSNNETQQYNFSSNDGSPLYIVFNSGSTENNFDELIVLDSDGITNLNADTPYGNSGDLAGLTFTTTGSSVTIYIESDFSVIGCEANPIDFDVFCGSNIGLIEVNAFLDENSDGIFNANEIPFTNGTFIYEVNNDAVTNTVSSNTGSFTITNQDENNSYDISFTETSGYENCFDIATSLFENVTVANGSTTVINFPVTELMPCEDVSVYLIPWSAPRPGFNYYNDLVIENLGSTPVTSGAVTFISDPIVNYVGETILDAETTVTPTATGATVNFTNLQPGESRIIWFQLYTPPTVSLGEFVTSSTTYTTAANDVNTANNTSVITQEVIGSYDPNDITESHGESVVYQDFTNSDEYLYYTVRFQNVGTADAINVRIENTLNPLLDVSTLQMLRSSHDVVMLQNNNQLTWTFNNINLPAQSQDDRGSNGYVYYKIKPTAGYTIGTTIPNTAEIYFDFNAPVITNTFITEFVEFQLSVNTFETQNFSLYPNPAKDEVIIKSNIALRGNTSVTIINVQGKMVNSKILNVNSLETQLNISNLESGLYFIKLKNGKTETIKKLIVK
ncbi:T9SS type A sorting domain-containing protein [Lacinutrix sp. 5H-3-7-4]|uniref:T9SS type A sorting domain-containing protein n=1 Tax=Lacinutrix sp. (strain 5H-3-7-4) TaxID=983544 RepID=UPI00020A3612|nr:T9SS type A sorting domain-containing protein [Lacinutrix sp. 5H-3-7-4]AEH01692.1 Fibronectin type III domain protein [Lacinutrix sp. 5H-3-7-4]